MLRDKIIKAIESCHPWEVGKVADRILALIEGERCVYTKHGQIYLTSCDMIHDPIYGTYCSKCGKRIEVKGEG